MSSYADKRRGASYSVVAAPTPKTRIGRGSTFRFADNRPEATSHLKQQEMANNSPQVRGLRAIHEITEKSARIKQLKATQSELQNGVQQKQAFQLQDAAKNQCLEQKPIQTKENSTGLPSRLKANIEHLSGTPLDDVKVQRSSPKPALLQAHAYAQGADIYLSPGQEKHLPHEAWHVVQQAQARAKPTKQLEGGVQVNDEKALEHEADRMGDQASRSVKAASDTAFGGTSLSPQTASPVLQGSFEIGSVEYYSKQDVDNTKGLQRYLKKLGPGYLEGAYALAADKSVEKEFTTQQKLKEYLDNAGKDYMPSAEVIKKAESDKNETATFLAEFKLEASENVKYKEVQSWGHCFNDDTHGSKAYPDVAKARAEKTMEGRSGVWLDEEAAKGFLSEIFRKHYKESTAILLDHKVPTTVGIEVDTDGKEHQCTKVFCKFGANGMLITAFPTNQAKVHE